MGLDLSQADSAEWVGKAGQKVVNGTAMGCEDAARALELIPAQEVSQQHNFGIV